ncbi:DNA-binding transcriptional MerR regulator [Lipingzhangella halophila]|uniref:DNA-binding transcriptional MerR regulator n=1 Tax=Lipingzhangella halophila TaxID=1783352 RepID=A0A7W7RLK0_9ACTN|nr:MerR family transcriptional regulator [Lipingzhangella halophila]MBB4934225.1 DNA-binding transcriptional MerR regulator [Lipingzhangella halophila]
MPTEMSIGALAERFGLAPHVLRHWEAAGVLRPARRVNGRRRYGPEHLAQVALILQAKEAGMSLDQMSELFQAENGAVRRQILAQHAAELDRKIARLRAARNIVEHPMNCPSEDFLSCPNLWRSMGELIPREESRAGARWASGSEPAPGA